MEKEATVNPKRIYGLVISLAVVATASSPAYSIALARCSAT